MAGSPHDQADEDLEAVVNRELLLLQPAVRADPAAVERLLHPEFREFGASGRVWERSEMIAALAADPGEGATPHDLRAERVGAGVVLVTYLARRPDRETLRSSLWVRDAPGWRLLFHQGTLRGDG